MMESRRTIIISSWVFSMISSEKFSQMQKAHRALELIDPSPALLFAP